MPNAVPLFYMIMNMAELYPDLSCNRGYQIHPISHSYFVVDESKTSAYRLCAKLKT